MNREDFERLIEQSPAGPRIEFGVCHGGSLELIAKHAGETFGVDSFEGMAEPGPFDINPHGVSEYPKGRLKVTIEAVQRRFAGYQRVRLIKGYVPEVLAEAPDGPFAFAHVDMDHYEPTAATIDWLWGRMVPGGILCCDDWFPGRDFLAGRAINEKGALVPFAGTSGRKAWWIR